MNLMLITKDIANTNIQSLGENKYITWAWEMDTDKAYDFIGGQVSFHTHKDRESFMTGRITNIINIGKGSNYKRNRVAFVFKKTTSTVKPAVARSKSVKLTESREQVRYV